MNTLIETTEKGTVKTTFGDCVITAITKSLNSDDWYAVKLEQETVTEYKGNSDNGAFKLNEVLGGSKPSVFPDKRTFTSRVSASVVNKLAVGQIIENAFIKRIKHATPQWEGHNHGANGYYYTTDFVTNVNDAKTEDKTNGIIPETARSIAQTPAETIKS